MAWVWRFEWTRAGCVRSERPLQRGVFGFGDYQAICGPEEGAAPGGRRWATRLGDGAAQEALGVAIGADGAVLVARSGPSAS